MKEVFTFDGKHYKTVTLKNGEPHCEKCAFNECRECEYSPAIPACDADKREDGLNIYFVPLKTNFDRITESQDALAEKIIHLWVNDCHRFIWLGIDCNGAYKAFRKKEDAFASTLEWLNKEADE